MSTMPEIRCPKLGHQVSLAYCLRMPEGHPCPRLFACWEDTIPALRTVVARVLPHDQWQRCFETPPSSKLDRLLELMGRVKNEVESPGRGTENR